jgi:hypothetical protein
MNRPFLAILSRSRSLFVAAFRKLRRSRHPSLSGKRSSSAVVQHGGKTWLLGGWTGAALLNDIWWTTPNGRWTRALAKAKWRPRAFFEAVSFRNQIFLFGGFKYERPNYVIGDVWASSDGINWACANPEPPWEAREHFGAVILNDAIFLFGGLTYLNPPLGATFRTFSDVWTSNDGYSWSQVTEEAPWGGRRGFGFAVYKSRIWLAGGLDERDRVYNDVWSSADGVRWQQETAAAGWLPRGGVRLVVFKGRLWVLGGNSMTAGVMGLNDIWSSEDGALWSLESAAAPWRGRSNYMTRVEMTGQPDEHLWILGGFDQEASGRQFYGDCWSTRDGKKWRLETPLALPLASPQLRG